MCLGFTQHNYFENHISCMYQSLVPFYYMDMPQFIYLLVDEPLGCFEFGAIINKSCSEHLSTHVDIFLFSLE